MVPVGYLTVASAEAEMKKPVYLDYSATTPVDPRVVEKMVACLDPAGNFGNAASRSHIYGWQAEEAVEKARRQVAELVNADPREIVWTSGATESDNLAIKGVARANAARGRHIITSSIEHKAVLDTCQHLQAEGFDVTYLKPCADGLTSPQQVEQALREDTILVSIMHANNEIGVVNDVAAMGALLRPRGVLFHVDGAQSGGKIPLDVRAFNIDLLSLTAHKMYGPKGIGALYVRRDPSLRIEAQIHGGGHERGMRSGTLATHQIVGMGEAAELAASGMAQEARRIAQLRDRLWRGLRALGEVQLNGDSDSRLPGLLNIAVAGVDGEALLMALKDLALSTGSACNSASVEPSHVLRRLGVSEQLAHASVRISLGRFTTGEEVDFSLRQFSHAVSKLREVRAGANSAPA